MRDAVVAHFTDGRLVKGYSEDFFPHKTTVHIAKDGSDGVQEIEIAGLKALFFVKSLTGDREYVDDQEFLGIVAALQIERLVFGAVDMDYGTRL